MGYISKTPLVDVARLIVRFWCLRALSVTTIALYIVCYRLFELVGRIMSASPGVCVDVLAAKSLPIRSGRLIV